GWHIDRASSALTPCSFNRFHISREERSTNLLRPMHIAGSGVTPRSFPLIALYTWAFEQRRLLAISFTERNSLFSFMVFCPSSGLSPGKSKILHAKVKKTFCPYRAIEMPFATSPVERQCRNNR